MNFGWGRQQAHRYLAAADTLEALTSQIGDDSLAPKNESQLLALSVVPLEKLPEIWTSIRADAEKAGQTVTAKAIRAHVGGGSKIPPKKSKPKSKPDARPEPKVPEPVAPVAEDPMSEIRRLASQLSDEQRAELALELAPAPEQSDETILAEMEAGYGRLGRDSQLGILQSVARWPAPRKGDTNDGTLDEFSQLVRALVLGIDAQMTLDCAEHHIEVSPPTEECFVGLTAVVRHLMSACQTHASEDRFVDSICQAQSFYFLIGKMLEAMWIHNDGEDAITTGCFAEALPTITEIVSGIPNCDGIGPSVQEGLYELAQAIWPQLTQRNRAKLARDIGPAEGEAIEHRNLITNLCDQLPERDTRLDRLDVLTHAATGFRTDPADHFALKALRKAGDAASVVAAFAWSAEKLRSISERAVLEQRAMWHSHWMLASRQEQDEIKEELLKPQSEADEKILRDKLAVLEEKIKEEVRYGDWYFLQSRLQAAEAEIERRGEDGDCESLREIVAETKAEIDQIDDWGCFPKYDAMRLGAVIRSVSDKGLRMALQDGVGVTTQDLHRWFVIDQRKVLDALVGTHEGQSDEVVIKALNANTYLTDLLDIASARDSKYREPIAKFFPASRTLTHEARRINCEARAAQEKAVGQAKLAAEQPRTPEPVSGQNSEPSPSQRVPPAKVSQPQLFDTSAPHE